jgi:RNA-directed DNA polymerase
MVPVKQGNRAPAGPSGGTGETCNMEPLEGKMPETLGSASVSTKLQRIAELARQRRAMALTTLAHHIDLEFMRVAHQRVRKDGAVGIDGQTAKEYGENLEHNLQDLLERFKSGRYWAPPVRRVYIPKGDGRSRRPIGIPTFEDKILQRAVTMVLEAVYEQDFLDCSYGFRPGRSAHQALDALWHQTMAMGGGVVLELDIRSFFDTLDKGQLRRMLDQRVRDGVIRRTIDKWLQAGVMEQGSVRTSTTGTPQGGVASPMLANIYLHEVLDTWFEDTVKPALSGKAFLIRYCDDAVMVFSREQDARRVLRVLPKRFAKYGLTLHPDKTRNVSFRRPHRHEDIGHGPARTRGSFDFLGIALYWGRGRNGSWIIRRKTAKERLNRAVKRVGQWCKTHRHWKVQYQWRVLCQKLRGHYAYFGVTGNYSALRRFFRAVQGRWRYWLNRRGQRRAMSWDRFHRLLEHYRLPPPVVVKSVFRNAAKP